MACSSWITRVIPFIGAFSLFVLLLIAFGVQPYGVSHEGSHRGDATMAQVLLSVYVVILHLLALLFPIRLCWSIFDLLAHLQQTSTCRAEKAVKNETSEPLTRNTVIFAILLPGYKEDTETLEDTLQVLAAHPQAAATYDVYLAMEQKQTDALSQASQLIETFRGRFRRIRHTLHPQGLFGEAQGKSSNVSWAAREAEQDYAKDPSKNDIILTVMDADTHLMPSYFEMISRMHSRYPATCQTSFYVPPIIFDRNMHKVPLGVRLADMLWCGAGLSGLHCSSRNCIPTSVYSLPLSLAERVGGWDTGPESIGEDLHMYLKCSLALAANLTTRIVYSPASQSNVDTDVKGVRGYFAGLMARYNQALRHTWGALDVGYTVNKSWDHLVVSRSGNSGSSDLRMRGENANWTAFYTAYNLHESLGTQEPTTLASKLSMPRQRLNLSNAFTIYYRLFEAHFLALHLILTLIASSLYQAIYPPALQPGLLYNALGIAGVFRFLGFITMLTFFALYKRYHRLCLGLRQESLRRGGLYDDFNEKDYFSKTCFPTAGFFEVFLFPVSGFLFGAIPALVAVTSHLWTDRLVYVVSLKPQGSASRSV